jgi:hypothetical protein
MYPILNEQYRISSHKLCVHDNYQHLEQKRYGSSNTVLTLRTDIKSIEKLWSRIKIQHEKEIITLVNR